MIAGTVLVGRPAGTALAACSSFAGVGAFGTTLIWDKEADLRNASHVLAACRVEALLVDPSDEPAALAAMAFRQMLHPPAPVVVLVADDPADVNVSLATLRVVAGSFPPVPLLICGDAANALLDSYQNCADELNMPIVRIADPTQVATTAILEAEHHFRAAAESCPGMGRASIASGGYCQVTGN